ncbi:conserved membrane protein of unknown function [Pseudodesulfovibrio profundus]|uniref:Potassium channel domain-containing protein n=1 Tax=Pseudodesulfovibrio profundus TaxID=57320 RepID=A0A2C8F7W4_9BACT|nr:potassium channel family protein [Pseudodesulfovibrio profundus]SOB57921.1 conserved membrane protein of unknown function [Pseudodesulfovibrio profundus]
MRDHLKRIIPGWIELSRVVASPTLLLAKLGKYYFNKEKFLKAWSLGFWLLAFVLLSKQVFAPTRLPFDDEALLYWCWQHLINGLPMPALMLFLPLCRCNEIVSAFIRDAFEKLPDREGNYSKANRDEIGMKQRLDQALLSFLELIMNFAILYTLLPKESWHSSHIERPLSVVDGVYYSVVTITTLGYGDLAPKSTFAKFLSVYEVLSGIVLLVVCLGVYLAYAGQVKKEIATDIKK